MLDPWIIEEIRKREEAEREALERGRPALEIPIEMPSYQPSTRPDPQPGEERGVVVIDF